MKTLISKLSLLTVIALLLNACSGTPPRPDWLSGDTPHYSSSNYLLGRGEAPSLEQAKDRARSDLAKIFEVAINESSEDIRVFKSRSEGGTVQSGGEAQVARTTLTHTDRVLEGVRIAETWQDPETQSFYALAVLPRSQAAAGLRQEIGQLDEATQRFLDQARDAKDPLDKIVAAQRAVQAQVARDGYQKTLKVVDRSGQGVPSTWSTARLRADVEELRGRLRIAVELSPGAPARLATITAGALSAAGYKTVPAKEADYVLATSVNMAEPIFREGWYWVTGQIDVQLRDGGGDRVRGTKRWPIKASAQDPAMARQRAWNQVNGWLKKELGDTLTAFALGEDD